MFFTVKEHIILRSICTFPNDESIITTLYKLESYAYFTRDDKDVFDAVMYLNVQNMMSDT